MIAIGIDPGKSGALAVMCLDEDKSNIGIKVVPFEEQAYRDTLECCKGDRVACLVEKVGAMPGQGVVSMFNFGRNLADRRYAHGVTHTLSVCSPTNLEERI